MSNRFIELDQALPRTTPHRRFHRASLQLETPRKPRPRSDRFWDAYLNYDTYQSSDQAWDAIGGNVPEIAEYGNSCAARISRGLNHGQAPIPADAPGANMNFRSRRDRHGKAGDDKRYIISAARLDEYFRSAWGAPDRRLASQADIDALRSSLQAGQLAVFTHSGHAGVVRAGYTDPYLSTHLPANAWILPPPPQAPASTGAPEAMPQPEAGQEAGSSTVSREKSVPGGRKSRWVEIDISLREQRRFPGLRAHARSGAAEGGRSTLMSQRAYAAPLAATDRALVVLIENGGVDLGIDRLLEALLEKVPGSSMIPDTLKREAVEYVRGKIRELTDSFLEGAELLANRYTSAQPAIFGQVIVLRNGAAFYNDLRDTLVRLSGQDVLIDLFILTHGGPNSIAVAEGTHITGEMIRQLKSANNNRPLRLRSVYMMNCHASTLNQAWLDCGARVAAGSTRNNYLPEPTMYFFWRNWKGGQSFNDAVTNAYRRTVDLLGTLLPDWLARRLLGTEVANLPFVLESAPIITGDGSVRVNTDDLTFTQSVSGSLSLTMLPSRTVSRSLQATPRTRSWGLSQRGLQMIKSFEGFRASLYDDPAGHCTIGYGTLVHTGNCNGAASEAPFTGGVSEERATELLMERINDFQRAINEQVTTELTDHQYDALVSFVYNVGTGAFARSTLLRKLNAGDYAAVPGELRKWVNAGGRPLPGLAARRNAEAELFVNGTYPP